MSFTQFKLDIATEQARGIFNTYVYETDDSIANIQAVGYFSRSRFADTDPDWLKAKIGAQCSDGFVTGFIDSSGNFNPESSAQTPIENNKIVVNEESDFPTQDATTITLETDTNYSLGASFSTTKRFIVQQGCNFTANNLTAPVLTYTGSGVMFTSTDAAFTMDRIRFDAPSASRGFACTDTTGNTKGINLSGVFFLNIAEWGTFEAYQALIVDNCGVFASTGKGGITVIGSGWFAFTVMGFAVISSSATCIAIDLGSSVHSFFDADGLVVIAPSGGIGIKGLASSANMVAGSLGRIVNNTFIGGMTDYLSGLTEDDIRYKFDGDANISDTNPDLLMSLTGNSTATTVSGGTPTLLAGTWNAVERASQFAGTTAGRGTFLGERTLAGPVDISVTVEPSSGNNKDISAYLAVDGSVVANSQTTTRVDNANPKTISIPWQIAFEAATFVEIYVSNDTDNVSVIGTSAILRIR